MTALAIDGPAGAGKSTVARAVAGALGWDYVDTGALYRALALAVIRHGADPRNEAAVAAVAARSRIEAEGSRVWLDGAEVTDAIRDRDVTEIVSTVSAHAAARAALLSLQREAAERGDVVMEGRDIGAVVLPEADAKVFLTATVEERARRRALELGLPTDAATLEAMARSLAARDRADATRAESPLARADDAHVVDTTGLTTDEVVARICAIATEAGRAR